MSSQIIFEFISKFVEPILWISQIQFKIWFYKISYIMYA
jgi:hypothetical protein